ncbi:MAG: glycosyltransferase family 1 protein, partial [Alphaproteobacteria bacterium]|nr:glycosyltransferase family 1 protein [Alphaproteobacteria bacterium]
RRFFHDNPARQHLPSDNLLRSARRFGLAIQEFNNFDPPAGVERRDYPAALRGVIESWRPRLIIFDDLFERGLSADPELRAPIGEVLETARRAGSRVVKLLMDGWLPAPDSMYRGLGTHFDLVNHLVPARLAEAAPDERAATYCCPFPFDQPMPSVPYGRISRVSFVGSVNRECPSRLAWWAESIGAGIPLDFLLTDHGAPQQRSDQEYINLLTEYRISVNFTRRYTGARIATGRTFEIPLSGGLLLEEDSADSRYFLKPGVHCVTFANLAELEAATRALLADPASCRRIAGAGQAWAKRYFTGDHFWAGILQRLDIGRE